MENLLTGYECLALFTDEVQEKIKANMANLYNDGKTHELMMKTYADAGDFLLGVFVWWDTAEEHPYWHELYNKCY